MTRNRNLAAPLLLLLLPVLLACVPAFAEAEPEIDLRPALSKSLEMGRWQPVLVTVLNPDGGAALEGEAQIALEDARTGVRFGTFARPIRLPRGPGAVAATVYVQMPDGAQPDIVAQVVRAGDGSPVASRRFTKIPILPNQLRVLAVTAQPGSLDYLNGETVGVYRDNGVLRPGTKRPVGYAYGGTKGYATPLRVDYPEPGLLPDRAIGYDAVGIVYLGFIKPDVYSDAQVDSLRRWVAGGGLLVCENGSELARDERFKGWVPEPQTIGSGKYGLGTVVKDWGDLEIPPPVQPGDFGHEVRRWKEFAHAGVASLPVGSALASNNPQVYPQFSAIVQKAPGLKAPSSVGVGLFLGIYLLLLVPVNYILLKRIDKREWTWVTVPALVLLFSLAAYGFGFSVKGGDMLQNVATVVEMGSGSGDATVSGAIGIFSPKRAHYDVEAALPGALLYGPEDWHLYNREYAPLTVLEGDSGGATAKDTAISMWAMRSFGVRGHLTLGEGFEVKLTQRNGQVTGTVTNRTKRTLENAALMVLGGSQMLGTIHPGETKTIAVPVSSGGAVASWSSLFTNYYYQGSGPWATGDTSSGLRIKQEMANSIALSVGSLLNQSPSVNAFTADDALLTAWSSDRLVPVRVNGQETPASTHVNLLLVHARVTQ